jgi:hypothetical protein
MCYCMSSYTSDICMKLTRFLYESLTHDISVVSRIQCFYNSQNVLRNGGPCLVSDSRELISLLAVNVPNPELTYFVFLRMHTQDKKAS